MLPLERESGCCCVQDPCAIDRRWGHPLASTVCSAHRSIDCFAMRQQSRDLRSVTQVSTSVHLRMMKRAALQVHTGTVHADGSLTGSFYPYLSIAHSIHTPNLVLDMRACVQPSARLPNTPLALSKRKHGSDHDVFPSQRDEQNLEHPRPRVARQYPAKIEHTMLAVLPDFVKHDPRI